MWHALKNVSRSCTVWILDAGIFSQYAATYQFLILVSVAFTMVQIWSPKSISCQVCSKKTATSTIGWRKYIDC